jgi:hypothetical protein
MKNLIIISLLIISINKSFSQTYELRRVDDYNPTSTVETARYIGNIQEKMQTRFDANYQKINDKTNSIDKLIRKLIQKHKSGEKILESERLEYLHQYYQNLDKLSKFNYTNNSSVIKVLNYLDNVESQLFQWL